MILEWRCTRYTDRLWEIIFRMKPWDLHKNSILSMIYQVLHQLCKESKREITLWYNVEGIIDQFWKFWASITQYSNEPHLSSLPFAFRWYCFLIVYQVPRLHFLNFPVFSLFCPLPQEGRVADEANAFEVHTWRKLWTKVDVYMSATCWV